VFSSGENVVVFNDSTGISTIYSSGGTLMYLAGTASTGDRFLSQRGLATILCLGTSAGVSTFVISGAGLT
jgi:hypothetical protein